VLLVAGNGRGGAATFFDGFAVEAAGASVQEVVAKTSCTYAKACFSSMSLANKAKNNEKAQNPEQLMSVLLHEKILP
jgi:hypothetical protein